MVAPVFENVTRPILTGPVRAPAFRSTYMMRVLWPISFCLLGLYLERLADWSRSLRVGAGVDLSHELAILSGHHFRFIGGIRNFPSTGLFGALDSNCAADTKTPFGRRQIPRRYSSP